MAFGVTHLKVDSIPDGTDPNQVQPSDWNAGHVLTGFTKLAGVDAIGGALGLVTQTAADVFAARSLVAGTGITITNPAGTAGNITISVAASTYQPLDAGLTALAALDATAGFVVQTALDTFVKRSLAAGSVAIQIGNPAGTAANPTIDVSAALTAVNTLVSAASVGFMVMTASNVLAARSFTAGAGVTITNADGVAGNVSIAVTAGTYQPLNATLTGLAALTATAGIVVQTSTDVFNTRVIAITGTGLTLTNGDGVAGNPTLALNLAADNTWTGINTWTRNLLVQKATPVLIFQDTTTAVVDNVVGWIQAQGPNSTPVNITYAQLLFRIGNFTAGAEAGYFVFRAVNGGVSTDPVTIRQGLIVGIAGGAADKGLGSVNALSYYVNGTDLFARANTWTGANTWTQNMTLQKAGPQLTLDGTAGGQVALVINGLAGNSRILYFMTGGTSRWTINAANTSAESGSNVGSDFNLSAYTDAGALLVTPMSFARATGIATFNSISTSTDWQFINTEDGAGGATTIWRKISASPAANDMASYQAFQANSSTGVNRTMATVFVSVFDPTNAAEDSGITFQTYVAGTLQSRWTMGAGLFYAGGADPGVNEINCVALNIAGTDIFARTNVWTGGNTFQSTGVNLVIDGLAGNPFLLIRSSAGFIRGVTFYTTTTERWRVSVGGGTESGANVSSDFSIGAYSDTGASIVVPVQITRSTGALTLNSIGTGANITINTTDDGANGSIITTNHISASPAAADGIFSLNINARDSTAVNTTYGAFAHILSDPTNGSEDGRWYFNTIIAGAVATRINIGGGLYAQGQVDPGNGGLNFTDLQKGGVSLEDIGWVWTAASHQFGAGTNPFTMYLRGGTAANIDMLTTTANANAPQLTLSHNGSNNASGNALISFRSNNNAGLFTYAYLSQVTTNGTVGAESGDLNVVVFNGGAAVVHKIGGNGCIWGAATGGQKGAGTINAVGVYGNGTILTCYVIEAANNNGKIDLERWDDFNYGKPHAPARKFAQRTNVLDVDQYIAEWKETGVLPGLPSPEAWTEAGGMSMDDMIQRLWETVEVLAVHIDQVNERAKAA